MEKRGGDQYEKEKGKEETRSSGERRIHDLFVICPSPLHMTIIFTVAGP